MKNLGIELPVSDCSESGLKRKITVNSLTVHPNGQVTVGYHLHTLRKSDGGDFKVEGAQVVSDTPSEENTQTDALVGAITKPLSSLFAELFAAKEAKEKESK